MVKRYIMDIITISLGSFDVRSEEWRTFKALVWTDEAALGGIHIKAPAWKEERRILRWSASRAEFIGRRSRDRWATAFESSR